MEKDMHMRSKEYIGNVIMPDTTAWSALNHIQRRNFSEESFDSHLEKLHPIKLSPKALRKMYKAYSIGRIK